MDQEGRTADRRGSWLPRGWVWLGTALLCWAAIIGAVMFIAGQLAGLR